MASVPSEACLEGHAPQMSTTVDGGPMKKYAYAGQCIGVTMFIGHQEEQCIRTEPMPQGLLQREDNLLLYGLLDDNDVTQLTSALLTHYEPDLVRVKSKLSELTKKQQSLIEQLKCESERFELSNSEFNLQESFAKVKVYHVKLVALKKEMAQLHEKSTKIKKRGLRLQEHRQKEALQRELSREREMQREQLLIQSSSSP